MNTTAKPGPKKRVPLVNETEWRAEWWHKLWMDKKEYHHPSKHINAFEVAPPLFPDGKRYCDKCSADFVPYAELPEPQKEYYRNIVRAAWRCEEDWQNVREGG